MIAEHPRLCLRALKGHRTLARGPWTPGLKSPDLSDHNALARLCLCALKGHRTLARGP